MFLLKTKIQIIKLKNYMLQLKMRAGKNTSRIPYTLRKSSLLVLILKTRFDAEMMEKVDRALKISLAI